MRKEYLHGEEGPGCAGGAGAARAPDAVDVRVDIVRQVVVDHDVNVRDVEAARGHVGRHEQRRRPQRPGKER